jgi:hypothetical protein
LLSGSSTLDNSTRRNMKIRGLGKILSATLIISTATFATQAQAGFETDPLAMFTTGGWAEFQDDAPVEDGANGPGVGGQEFDAEYLFYRWNGSVLDIALQTGFDVLDGKYKHTDNRNYWSGDLGLSFDNDADNDGAVDSATWEYGIDFGLKTKTYNQAKIDFDSPGVDNDGIDDAGLYEVSAWDNQIYSGHHISDPYAITDIVAGSKVDITTTAGYHAPLNTFYRIVSFDTTDLAINITGIDVHWTMSCGNDNINGHIAAPVPAPATLAMLLLGLMGLGGAQIRRRYVK